jgi:hypothetical protein
MVTWLEREELFKLVTDIDTNQVEEKSDDFQLRSSTQTDTKI